MLSSGLRHQVKGRAVVVDGVAAGVVRGVAAPVLITGEIKCVYVVAILWLWNKKKLRLFFARWVTISVLRCGPLRLQRLCCHGVQGSGMEDTFAGIASICYSLSEHYCLSI